MSHESDHDQASERLICAADRGLASTLGRGLERYGLLVIEAASVHPRGLVAVCGLAQSIAASVADKVAAMQQLSSAFIRDVQAAPAGNPTWARVIDSRTLASIGVELWVTNDDDASVQLDLLARAVPDTVHRDMVTIHPPPCWQAYGDPLLIDRYRRR